MSKNAGVTYKKIYEGSSNEKKFVKRLVLKRKNWKMLGNGPKND